MQGTFRPFATHHCVNPPPFLAIHHCVCVRACVRACVYLKFSIRSTYDSALQRAKISLGNVVSQFTNTGSDDLMISQVNRVQEKPCDLRKMFDKLDGRRKSSVTLALL